MNKLTCTTLEGKTYVIDLRTNHPVDGFAMMGVKTSDSTIWGAKHSPHNRELMVTMNGDGYLKLYKYNYPPQRFLIDPEGRKKGVIGNIELLNDQKIADQPIVGFDWNKEKIGLGVATSLDQKLQVILVTKLNKF